jgi:hypothetical protein
LLWPLLFALTIPATGTFELPPGTVEIADEIRLPDGAHDLTIVGGRNTTLHAMGSFNGRAILSCKQCRGITFRDFAVDGNRAALEQRQQPPPGNLAFAKHFRNNAILVEDSDGVTFQKLRFRNVAAFAILVKTCQNVLIEDSSVRDSGSRNALGRNNTTGGFLLEEGSGPFKVARSHFENILGNGLWTHSYYWALRNHDGEFTDNTFDLIGRDAIQVGRSTRVQVHGNRGRRIGFPVEAVDREGLANPVGIDTAGNVDDCTYENNSFEEVNGKCIDLDGFHDGVVRANTCINRGKPEDYIYGNFGIALNNAAIVKSENITIADNRLEGMKFGGIFVVGSGHRIVGNRMTKLNLAHSEQPGLLASGIYLAGGAERVDPARNLRIEDNVISGYGMAAHCVGAAPTVKLSESVIRKNTCRDE